MSFEKEMEDREDPAYEAYMECMVTEVKPRDEKIEALSAKLSALKSRLPVNADGDVVLWGEKIPYRNHLSRTGGTCVGEVVNIRLNDSPNKYNGSHILFISPQREWIGCVDCYSSIESCRAAHSRDTDTD